jgi:hypothetical protein
MALLKGGIYFPEIGITLGVKKIENSMLIKRYCPANSNRGQYYAQIIRAGKLEVRPFFFLNFKGTPSQKEHKTIFSGLKISTMALSG